MSTLVAAVRSVVAYITISIYILVAGPIGLFVGGVVRSKRGMYAIGRAGVWLALKLTGIRYTVTGLERVGRLPVVFCANHESNVDPAVLFLALHKQLHVFYKAELRNVPLMGTVFDVGGFVGVERGNREKSMASIAAAAESLRAGNSFLIFPEGTRSRTGQLLPFKKGGFIMAIQGQVPIVPVAVHGGRSSMRKGSPIVRPTHVQVRVGQPIPTVGLTVDDRDKLIAQVRAEVQRLLDEM